MKTRTLIGAIVLALVGASYPTAAYHISGGVNAADTTLTSGDWFVGNGILILCESDGDDLQDTDPQIPNAAGVDDRNDNPAGPKAGEGGLCTTGRNSATVSGVARPADRSTIESTDADRWTKLDTCSKTVLARAVPGDTACTGTYGPGVDDDAYRNDVSWTAEVGVYSCFIPRQGDRNAGAPTRNEDPRDNFNDDATGGPKTGDMALYYLELYAWWSYDGDGTYGEDNGPLTEDGGTRGVDPGETRNAYNGDRTTTFGSDWAGAWHGHVSMFIEQTEQPEDLAAQRVPRGSAVATTVTEDGLPNTHSGGHGFAVPPGSPDEWLGRGPINPALETRGNDCGGSPAGPGEREAVANTVDCSDTGTFEIDETCGPAIRAP